MNPQVMMQAAQMAGDFGKALGDPNTAALFGLLPYFAASQTKRELDRLDNFNRQVTQHTAQTLFDLERQRVSERMRTTSALVGYNAQRDTTLSSLRAQYGATDVIGSSSNALKQAYAFQFDQAIAQENFNFEVGIDNYNTSVMQTVNQGLQQLRYSLGAQQSSMTPQAIAGVVKAGANLFGGGQGGMLSGVNNGGSGGILGTGSGGGYSGTTMDMNISNVNFGGSGSLGIA